MRDPGLRVDADGHPVWTDSTEIFFIRAMANHKDRARGHRVIKAILWWLDYRRWDPSVNVAAVRAACFEELAGLATRKAPGRAMGAVR